MTDQSFFADHNPWQNVKSARLPVFPDRLALQCRLSRRKASTVSESQLQLVNKFPCEGLPEI